MSLLVVSAIPLLAFQYFPSQDGPAHVANAAIILNFREPVIAEYYSIALSQGTNLLGDVLLAGLLSFIPASLAERMMALLLLVGLPLSVRWCLRELNANAVWLSILVIPLAGGFLLYKGFYNFLVGVILSFLAFRFWLKRVRSGQTHVGIWALFTLLTALVYLAHPLPLLALLLMISAAALDDSLEDARRSRAGLLRSTFNRLFPVFLAAVIPLVFLIAVGAGTGSEIGYTGSLATRLLQIPQYLILSLSSLEIPFAVLPPVAIGLLGVLALFDARSSLWRTPGFPIAIVLLTVIYLLGPNSIGVGSQILARVVLYLTVITLFWLAGSWTPRWANVTAVVLVSAATVGLMTVRIPVHAETNAMIQEYLSGQDTLNPGSTVLSIWASALERGPVDRLRQARPLHPDGYLTASGDVIDLSHFTAQATTFPVQFNAGYGIKDLLKISDFDAALRFGPDLIDLDEYERLGPGPIDYVWLWGRTEADTALIVEAQSQLMLQHLEDEYELVFVSAPRGLLEVYAKNGLSSSGGGSEFDP